MRESRESCRLAIADGPVSVDGHLSRSLVCFSHLRWNFVRQRPQHLLSRAARDYDVTFFEEPLFEDLNEPELRVSRVDGVRVAVPVLPHPTTTTAVDAGQQALVDAFIEGNGQPDVLWYYTPMAMAFTRHLEAGLVVYDNMDELSAFRGASPEMLRNEDELFGRADLVFTGGQSLFEAKRDRHPRVVAFPSSIDVRHFAAAREPGIRKPDDQAAIPGPRLGFFGVIDERLDLELLAETAAARLDWHFVMIGPVVKIDAATLPRRANIQWLGQRDYADLPAYLAGWQVGLMPFARNEATRFISPTKTPEFLAAGVPVVSTSIRDVVRPYGDKGLVAIADTADEFVAAAERAMAGRDAGWLGRVDRHLAAGSWDATWSAMNAQMTQAARSGVTVANAVPALAAAE